MKCALFTDYSAFWTDFLLSLVTGPPCPVMLLLLLLLVVVVVVMAPATKAAAAAANQTLHTLLLLLLPSAAAAAGGGGPYGCSSCSCCQPKPKPTDPAATVRLQDLFEAIAAAPQQHAAAGNAGT
jgi:hypothetical protein